MDNSFSSLNLSPEQISDEDLIKSAKNGDEQAVSLIVIRFIPMVKKIALSFRSQKEDVDDLSQEGLIALIKAIYAYSFDSGASFSTFAFTCVRNRIISVLRKFSNGDENKNLSFSDETELLNETGERSFTSNPEQLLLNKEKVQQIHRLLKEILSSLEYDVLMLHSMNFSYAEISDKLNISSKSVDNALQRIRRKISFEIFT